jgi:hypothetical protein
VNVKCVFIWIVTLCCFIYSCECFRESAVSISGEMMGLAGSSQMLIPTYHMTELHILEDSNIKIGHIDSNEVHIF